MRILTLAMAGGLALAATNLAYAQDEEGADASAPAAAAEGADAGETAGNDEATSGDGGSGQSYSTTEARFPVRRGLFVEADLGMFLSFGGKNTNVQVGQPTSKGVSNLQPVVGLFVGYDLASTDTVNFAAGFKTGLLANGGAGRVTNNQIQDPGLGDPTTRSNDFEMWELGLAGTLDYYLTDRIALTGKLGGGMIVFNPSPFEASNVAGGDATDALAFPNAGSAAFGGFAAVSVGAIINTQLPGFTFGIHNRMMFFFGGQFFMGYNPEFALKYNF